MWQVSFGSFFTWPRFLQLSASVSRMELQTSASGLAWLRQWVDLPKEQAEWASQKAVATLL
jgi:hypothetical protein